MLKKRSKFNLRAGKQALNIAIGYNRLIPEVLVDEKLQNFFDEVNDDIEAGEEFNQGDVNLIVEIEKNSDVIVFKQLGTSGIKEKDWEGIFEFGAETKSSFSSSAGAFGQGWKTWLPFCKEIKIYSHPSDPSEKPYYTEISWMYEEETGKCDDIDAFPDRDGPAYLLWDIPNGHELESKTGSIWIFKLFNLEKDVDIMVEETKNRSKEFTFTDFYPAFKKIVYQRYYHWLNEDFLNVEMRIH